MTSPADRPTHPRSSSWTLSQTQTSCVPRFQWPEICSVGMLFPLSHSCYNPTAWAQLEPVTKPVCYLRAFRGVMLKGGPGRPSTFGNMSIHICSFPCKDTSSSFMFYAHAHTLTRTPHCIHSIFTPAQSTHLGTRPKEMKLRPACLPTRKRLSTQEWRKPK